jgi:hypothetical protein
MIRHLEERDYDSIISVIDDWWAAGRCRTSCQGSFLFTFARPASRLRRVAA